MCTEEPQTSCTSSVFVIKLGYRVFSQKSDEIFHIVMVPWVLKVICYLQWNETRSLSPLGGTLLANKAYSKPQKECCPLKAAEPWKQKMTQSTLNRGIHLGLTL